MGPRTGTGRFRGEKKKRKKKRRSREEREEEWHGSYSSVEEG
jgi:hypothetical protein